MFSLTSSPSAAPLARTLGALLVLLFGLALALGGPISADAFAHLNEHGHAHLHLHGHPFVDARSWLGIPNAMDVLSNLPFILLGLWVVGRSRVVDPLGAAKILGMGLLLTGLGSGLYHWIPDAHTLVADRLGMAVAFAGALALATHSLLGQTSARHALVMLLPGAALAALLPAVGGNLLPWIVVQFGGLLWLALAAWAPRQAGAVPVRWVWVMAGYAVAKGLEMHDTELFQHSGGWVSGHTLKHLAAAMAVLPIVLALPARQADR